MSCVLEEQANGRWLLCGEINFHSVIALRERGEAVMRSATGALCFDFADVRQTNTAALTLLLCWIRYAKQRDCELRFENLPRELHSMAAVSELDELLK